MAKAKLVTDISNKYFTNNKINIGTAAPTTGTYKAGDVVYSSSPNSTAFGWICTAAGTPGTWKVLQSGADASAAWGNISGKPSTFAPTIGTTSTTAFRGDYGNTAYNHSQSAHAPSNAQKNSDITKAEIDAKLTGSTLSHNHDGMHPRIHNLNTAGTTISYTRICSMKAMVGSDRSELHAILFGGTDYGKTQAPMIKVSFSTRGYSGGNLTTNMVDSIGMGNCENIAFITKLNGDNVELWVRTEPFPYPLKMIVMNATHVTLNCDGNTTTAPTGNIVTYNVQKVYHTGFKPNATDVGALPISGGTLTHKLTVANNYGLYGKTTGGLEWNLIGLDTSNKIYVGWGETDTYHHNFSKFIRGVQMDATLMHKRPNTKTCVMEIYTNPDRLEFFWSKSNNGEDWDWGNKSYIDANGCIYASKQLSVSGHRISPYSTNGVSIIRPDGQEFSGIEVKELWIGPYSGASKRLTMNANAPGGPAYGDVWIQNN